MAGVWPQSPRADGVVAGESSGGTHATAAGGAAVGGALAVAAGAAVAWSSAAGSSAGAGTLSSAGVSDVNSYSRDGGRAPDTPVDGRGMSNGAPQQ